MSLPATALVPDDEDAQDIAAWTSRRDEVAFTRLVNRWLPLVAAVARRRGAGADADDVIQAVFLALSRKAGRISHRQLAGWLHQAAVLASKAAIRARERRRRHESVAPLPPSPDEKPDLEALQPVIDDALDRLSPAQREAVLLRVVAGWGPGDIGRRLGISADAARMRADSGLEALRRLLQRRGFSGGTAALCVCLSTEQPVAASTNSAELAHGVLHAPTAAAEAYAAGIVGTSWVPLALLHGVLVAVGTAAIAIGPGRDSAAVADPPTPPPQPPPQAGLHLIAAPGPFSGIKDILDAAWAPDGSLLLLRRYSTIERWQVAPARLLEAKDGSAIASAPGVAAWLGTELTIISATGSVTVPIPGEKPGQEQGEFLHASAAGVVAIRADGVLIGWDVGGRVVQAGLRLTTSDMPRAVALSPTGDRLAVIDAVGRLQVLHWPDGQVIASGRVGRSPVVARLNWSADHGLTLACSTYKDGWATQRLDPASATAAPPTPGVRWDGPAGPITYLPGDRVRLADGTGIAVSAKCRFLFGGSLSPDGAWFAGATGHREPLLVDLRERRVLAPNLETLHKVPDALAADSHGRIRAIVAAGYAQETLLRTWHAEGASLGSEVVGKDQGAIAWLYGDMGLAVLDAHNDKRRLVLASGAAAGWSLPPAGDIGSFDAPCFVPVHAHGRVLAGVGISGGVELIDPVSGASQLHLSGGASLVAIADAHGTSQKPMLFGSGGITAVSVAGNLALSLGVQPKLASLTATPAPELDVAGISALSWSGTLLPDGATAYLEYVPDQGTVVAGLWSTADGRRLREVPAVGDGRAEVRSSWDGSLLSGPAGMLVLASQTRQAPGYLVCDSLGLSGLRIAGGRAVIEDLRTGARLAEAVWDGAGEPSFSPDGRRVVWLTKNWAIAVLDTYAGAAVLEQAQGLAKPALTPAERRLAVRACEALLERGDAAGAALWAAWKPADPLGQALRADAERRRAVSAVGASSGSTGF